MNRSCTSAWVVVRPQDMWPFCPIMKKGWPGRAAPEAAKSGVTIRAKCHMPGALRPRCGSLASKGLPDWLRDPATTHSLDALAAGKMLGMASASPCHWIAGAAASARVVGALSGSSCQRSRICCSSRASDRRVRRISARQSSDSRSAISRTQAALSVSCQGSGSMPRTMSSAGRTWSGAASQAFTPCV